MIYLLELLEYTCMYLMYNHSKHSTYSLHVIIEYYYITFIFIEMYVAIVTLQR